jgi:hypothetical protein
VVLGGADAINDVLGPVYRHLDIPFDPAATGALSDVKTVDADDFSRVLAITIADGRKIETATVSQATRTAALSLRADHDPSLLA